MAVWFKWDPPVETNHTVEIHTIEHITVDTTIGQGSMK